jgi:hypothetical protein
MVPVNGAKGAEADRWQNGKTANVLQARSLVPNAVREWMAVAGEQYLSPRGMAQFRDITDSTGIPLHELRAAAASAMLISDRPTGHRVFMLNVC